MIIKYFFFIFSYSDIIMYFYFDSWNEIKKIIFIFKLYQKNKIFFY